MVSLRGFMATQTLCLQCLLWLGILQSSVLSLLPSEKRAHGFLLCCVTFTK